MPSIPSLDDLRRCRATGNATTAAISSSSTNVAISAGTYDVFSESAGNSVVFFKIGANTTVTAVVAAGIPAAPNDWLPHPIHVSADDGDAFIAGITRAGTAVLYCWKHI